MPTLPPISTEELVFFIEGRELYSRGIELVDVQLLGSVVVDGDTTL